jgi:hypothetical protein
MKRNKETEQVEAIADLLHDLLCDGDDCDWYAKVQNSYTKEKYQKIAKRVIDLIKYSNKTE